MIATMTIMKPNFGDFNYGNGSVSTVLYGVVSDDGMLKFRSYAKLSGTVHLMKIVNKRKTIEMDCILNLNFTSHSIHHSRC
ncbi:hypothetical protein Lal_00007817 [Lupinus albus]|nr:hypothetical protein Lal_00007817 [Lupinus albus]